MLVDFEVLCEFITDEYKVDYIVIDKDYSIDSYSKSVVRFFEFDIELKQDIRDNFYELIGYEDELYAINQNEQKDFHLKNINKNNFYIDIYVRNIVDCDLLVIFIMDTTEQTKASQVILQDRNDHALLVRELAHKNHLLNKYKKTAEEGIPRIQLDCGFKIVHVNNSFLDLLEYSMDELNFQDFDMIIDSSNIFDKDIILKELVNQKVYNITLKLNRKCGSLLYVNSIFVPIVDNSGKLYEIVVFAHDITIHKNKHNYLKDMLAKDSLTKLVNRYGLDEKLDRLLEKKDEFVLLFLDLDFFKVINDMYGHHYGDAILKKVANRLNRLFIEDATIARYGGDEFVIILQKPTELEMVRLLAQQTIDEVSREYYIDNLRLKIGVSIGIVYYPKDASNRYDLLHNADKAMYVSKDRGRNKFHIYGDMIESSLSL